MGARFSEGGVPLFGTRGGLAAGGALGGPVLGLPEPGGGAGRLDRWAILIVRLRSCCLSASS